MVLAVARLGYIYYERHSEPDSGAGANGISHGENAITSYNITLDDSVFLRPAPAYDLRAARAPLAGKTVWEKAGNSRQYYPFTGSVNWGKPAGILPPTVKLVITDVRESEDQVMAVFHFENPKGEGAKPGNFAVPIGKHGLNYVFAQDDIFFYEDPHELYKHWGKTAWDAIDKHQVVKGMNERQVAMAIGIGRLVTGGGTDVGNRTLEVEQAGHYKLDVTFEQNKVTKIE